MNNADVSSTEMKEVTVDIVLSDGFVLTELAGVVDVLRLANRVIGEKVFTYRYMAKKEA